MEERMIGITKNLVQTSTRLRLDDLPKEDVDKTKLVLLDSIGCALASPVVDRGRLAIGLFPNQPFSLRKEVMRDSQRIAKVQEQIKVGMCEDSGSVLVGKTMLSSPISSSKDRYQVAILKELGI